MAVHPGTRAPLFRGDFTVERLTSVARTPGSKLNYQLALLGRRLTVRLQTLDLRIGVRIPASQPTCPSCFHHRERSVAPVDTHHFA